MEWKCPRCQTIISISSSTTAKQLKCPGCQQSYQVKPRKNGPIGTPVEAQNRSEDPKIPEIPPPAPRPTGSVQRANPLTKQVEKAGLGDPHTTKITAGMTKTTEGTSSTTGLSTTEHSPAHTADTDNNNQKATSNDKEFTPSHDSKLLTVRAEARARNKRRQRWTLFYALLMIALCGSALVYLYNSLDFDDLARNLNGQQSENAQTTIATTAVSGENASSGQAEEGVASESVNGNEAAEPKESPRELPPITHPPYGLISLKQMESVWDNVRPYSARLIVHRGPQVSLVAATVIDARGWLLTSRQAIAGATRIEVQMAPRSPMVDFDPTTPLDDVRGIIAESAELDLIVLQVNRDLINIFRPLAFDVRPLVGNKVLVQVCPPDETRWPWFQEAKLQKAVAFDLLSGGDQQQLLSLGIPWDLNRVTNPRSTSSSAGAALYTPTGDLAGINTSCELSSGRVVIETLALERWLNTWTSQVIAMTPLVLEKQNKSDDPSASRPDGGELGDRWLERLQPFRENQWQIEDQSQFAKLQAIVVDLHDTLQSLSAQSEKSQVDIATETILLEAKQEIFAAWSKLEADERMKRNQWALEIAANGSGLLYCVQVHMPVIASPEIQNQPTVTLRIEGTDQFLIVKTDPEERLLIRSSRWLIWGQRELGRPLQMMDELGVTLEPERFEVLSWIGEIR